MPEFQVGKFVKIKEDTTLENIAGIDAFGVSPGMYGQIRDILQDAELEIYIEFQNGNKWWFPKKWLVITDKPKIDENIKLGDD